MRLWLALLTGLLNSVVECAVSAPASHLSAFQFFQLKSCKFATGIFCSATDARYFAKLFASNEMATNAIAADNRLYLDTWADSILSRVAVVVHASCHFSRQVIEFASSNRLFDLTRHWLIYLDKHYTVEQMQEAAYDWRPVMYDVNEYLDRNVNSSRERLIKDINKDINEDILRDSPQTAISRPEAEPDDILKLLVTMNANVDSEVTVAVPALEQPGSFTLYELYRVSVFSQMLITEVGSILNGTVSYAKTNLDTSSTNYRTNFHGVILRSASPLLYFGYFDRRGELGSVPHDRSAMVGLDLHLLLEQMLNFRTAIKVMDLFGWAENGSFTGAVGYLFRHDAEMVTVPILTSLARLPAMDVVSPVFNLRLGIIFRDPTLAQVANVFVLPFSSDVWLCVSSFFLLTTFLLYTQLKATDSLDGMRYSDIVMYFTGAAFQQGTDMKIRTLSMRFTLIVFLIASLFLFTAYSANIVALLQSPSNVINSVKDVVDSMFDFGILNHQYLMKLIEDDNTSVTLELKKKKIKPLGESVYMSIREGMANVKSGLFAYQTNLALAYEEIGNVYNEYEKCGLKEILDYGGSISCMTVAKKSPYKEIFKQKHLIIRENGIMKRTYRRRFPSQKPTCKNDGGRFASVGLIEVSSVFRFLCYGALLALVVFLLETLLKRNSRKLSKPSKTAY